MKTAVILYKNSRCFAAYRFRSRDLWRTPSLFQNHGERGFAVPKEVGFG